VRADHGPRGGRGDECGTAKRRRRSGRNWTGASADASGSVLPATGSIPQASARARQQATREQIKG
jgi:hypothetical protein